MGETREYSKRLGPISDAQFEAVAARWSLGEYLGADSVKSGLFGQNVFVSTTQGEFVLRGAPHWVKGLRETEWRREDRWQFTKEVFFARQLHEHTKAPVPWPMLHDEASDIFGWPYIVMPRMPGTCFEDRTIVKSLCAEDRREVAIALGTNLSEMQKLASPFAGDFDIETIALVSYPQGNTQRVIDETAVMLEMAARHRAIVEDDREWLAHAAIQAQAAPGVRPNTFVHGDYKLNNLTLMKGDDGWRVSGLFDLHEARFADGALDLVRQACSYIDTDTPLAKVFVDSYFSNTPVGPPIVERMPLYVINDRMKFWEFFSRPDSSAPWTQRKTFREWALRYVDSIMNLL